MTANQLSYQRNLVAEDEARTAAMRQQTEALARQEAARHNLAQEELNRKQYLLDKQMEELRYSQQERENIAKYGTFAYEDHGEERPWIAKFAKGLSDTFGYLLKPLKGIFGGK